MKNIRNWVEGKPPYCSFFCILLASSSQELQEDFRGIGQWNYRGEKLPAPLPNSWFNLYRQHRKVLDLLFTITEDFSPYGPEGAALFQSLLHGARQIQKLGVDKALQEFNDLPKDERQEETAKTLSSFKKILDLILEDLRSEFAGETMPDALKTRFREALWPSEATAFFLHVWMPCLILYKTTPTFLYRKARQGDLIALDLLLRLDPLLITNPALSKIFHRLVTTGKRNRYSDLLAAAQKTPKGKITQQKNKVRIAALISLLSPILGCPLNEPEIRALFDALAQDSGRGDIDTDLPDGAESFSKAIQRERHSIKKVMTPDKR